MSDDRRRESLLRYLVIRRSLAERTGTPLESLDPAAVSGSTPGSGAVQERVAGALDAAQRSSPPDEIGEPGEFRHAREVLLREVADATARLDADPAAELDGDGVMALEAIIRIDGSAPSLLIRDGTCDAGHPFASGWSGELAATRAMIRDRARAVGRIEPVNGTADNYFGTGWVVDAGRGLVLTNWHVVEAIQERLPHLLTAVQGGFRLRRGVQIDFAGESGSLRRNRFDVVEARVSGAGSNWPRLDAAVLTIEPSGNGDPAVPPAVPVTADPDGAMGRLASYCAVGFPGRLQHLGKKALRQDWTRIQAAIFGSVYGVKRLSPGRTLFPLGYRPSDHRGWIFEHDLTTMRGSSGSPLLAWLSDDPRAFGLHRGGRARETNEAHAFAAARREFAALGVPLGASG